MVLGAMHHLLIAISRIKLRFRERHTQIPVCPSLVIVGDTDDLKWTALGGSSIDSVPIDSASTQEPQIRMIGDFDDGANALWTLYGKEAKSHDEAHIHTLKEDMDGVLIFVRSRPHSHLWRELIPRLLTVS